MDRGFQRRALFTCWVIVALFSIISVRLIQLQLSDRKRYQESARKTFERKEILPSLRGTIVDANDEVVAKSTPVSALWLNKTHLKDPKVISRSLAYADAKSRPEWKGLDEQKQKRMVSMLRGKMLTELSEHVIQEKYLAFACSALEPSLQLKRGELRKMIEGNRASYFALMKEVPVDVAENVREVIEDLDLAGFEWKNSLKRWYPNPTLAAHIIGFTGEKEFLNDQQKIERKTVGLFGTESAMESYLNGKNGWRTHRRDQYGFAILGVGEESVVAPRNGLNVQLTVDMRLQTIVEEELDACMKEYRVARAAVVLLDPRTGGVLAMASRPSFDLNKREKISENGFNFAIQAIYEPGSTFKIISSSGALNERLVTPFTSIFCHNGLYVEGKIRVPDHEPYATLTFEGVLQKSSNVGAYKLAKQLGTKRFYEYANRFGFGKKTGITLSGESSGRVKNTNNPTDFSRASYGYAVSVTPLQVADAYATIANGGRRMEPHIVKSVVANDGTVVKDFTPQVISQVLTEDTAKKMRNALKKVVEKGGTATAAAVDGFSVAGKTGTARKHNPNGRGYLEGRYTVSFVGMMPAENPAFVMAVVMDDPRTTSVARYGGTIAAPAFRKIATRLAPAMSLQPTKPLKKETQTTDKSER